MRRTMKRPRRISRYSTCTKFMDETLLYVQLRYKWGLKIAWLPW
jgi:hypothetical protein